MNRASDLLDCNNPGVNVVNAGLGVGQSLTDSDAGVTLTTLDQGGVAPNEYLDIQITLQPRVGFETPQVTSSSADDAGGHGSRRSSGRLDRSHDDGDLQHRGWDRSGRGELHRHLRVR